MKYFFEISIHLSQSEDMSSFEAADFSKNFQAFQKKKLNVHLLCK